MRFQVETPSGGTAYAIVIFNMSQGGCPFVDVKTARAWQVENSILGRSVNGALSVDTYRLKYSPAIANGRVRLRIRENEQEVTTLDQVQLLAVDHSSAVQALRVGSRSVLAAVQPAYRVRNAAGEDVTGSMSNGGFYHGEPGDTLYVEMTAPGTGTSARPTSIEDGDEGGAMLNGFQKDPPPENMRQQIVSEAAARNIDAQVLDGTGILVDAADGHGGWRPRMRYYPREYGDNCVVDSVGNGPLRLVFVGRHNLNTVGRLVGVTDANATPLSLLTAQHSRLGSVRAAVGAPGGLATVLATGDTLNLEFGSTEIPAGLVRDYFLVSTGVYSSAQAASQRPIQTEGVPAQFALAQNRPNPFARTTVINFALPTSEHVRLEVFDLQGRLVRLLTNRTFAPGYRTIEWDRRDDGGAAVRAGVYLYRIQAGSFVQQKKMVLLAE